MSDVAASAEVRLCGSCARPVRARRSAEYTIQRSAVITERGLCVCLPAEGAYALQAVSDVAATSAGRASSVRDRADRPALFAESAFLDYRATEIPRKRLSWRRRANPTQGWRPSLPW